MGAREGNAPATTIEQWVLRAGALAAAVASIVGVVALLWPDPADSPQQPSASLRKLVVDSNISLREYSQRQQLAAAQPGAPDQPHDGRVLLVTQTSQPPPEPPSTESQPPPTTDQPPAGAEEPPGETPDGPMPDTNGEPPQTEEQPPLGAAPLTEVAQELDERLPASELPDVCVYAEQEGEIELVCANTQALIWADDEPAAGEEQGTRTVDAGRVLRVLRGTRTGSSNEPVGVSVNFALTLRGLRGVPTDVRWSLYDARGRGRVPRDWLVNRRALTARPEADLDRASGSFWVPLPRRSGPFFVRVSIFGEDDRPLDFADSKRFR